MEIIGYEILGRISDEYLPSNPSELLKLAQSFGYDSDLSALFREVGVDSGKNLPGSPVLFVNTTPMEVYKINTLLESLKKIHDMAPTNRIVVEINEEAITNKNEMSRLRNGLEKLNIGLAFDDFGTGQTDEGKLDDIGQRKSAWKKPNDYTTHINRAILDHGVCFHRWTQNCARVKGHFHSASGGFLNLFNPILVKQRLPPPWRSMVVNPQLDSLRRSRDYKYSSQKQGHRDDANPVK